VLNQPAKYCRTRPNSWNIGNLRVKNFALWGLTQSPLWVERDGPWIFIVCPW